MPSCAPSRLVFVATSLVASTVLANSGVQLRLDNYAAGTESTTPGPIVNPGFELATGNTPNGWTPDSPVMTSGAPDPANLPNPASVVGTRSALASQAGGISPFTDYFLTQDITLAPSTDYVISAYIWNYAVPGPAPHNDFFAGDLAVVQLRDSQNFFNTAGIILEPIAKDNLSGSRGYFVYKTFNSGQFSPNPVTLEVNFDPNQDLQFGVNRPALSAQWDNIALTPLTQFAAQRFTSAAGGAWSNPSNWTNGPADAIGAIASFLTDTAGAAVVSNTGTVTLAAINFDANGGYQVTGPGTLRLHHEEAFGAVILNNLKSSNGISAPVQVQAGTANLGGVVIVPRQVQVNVNNPAGVLNVSGGITAAQVGTLGTGTFDLTKRGPGRFDTRAFTVRNLIIDEGTLRILPGASALDTIRTQNLTIAGGTTPTARLNVSDNAVVIDYTGDSPLATVYAQIQAGYTGGAWTGNGIVTQMGTGYAVGYAEASSLTSVPPFFGSTDATTLLLRGTLAGDADLNGTVNIGDFSILAANFNSPGQWFRGDFNYDGTVNIADFSALAANFNRSVAASATARAGEVPEPSSVVFVALGALTLLRRRR